MVTRFRDGTTCPTQRLNLHVSSISLLSKSYRDAFNDPNWQNAMREEYTALIKNKIWILVPRPTDTNIVRCMWLFRHKYLTYGTLSRYKAHLVANGSTQLEGVDVDETFSPAVSLWAQAGPSSLVSMALLQQIITFLHQEFFMTDLSSHNYFLGISVTQDSSQMFLSQKKYVVEILERAHMVNCNLVGLLLILSLNWKLMVMRSLIRLCIEVLQPTLSRSSAEAEYHGVANAVDETCWLRHLLRELLTPLSFATLVYCENVSQVHVLHVPSRYQYADIFTKGLPSALFEEFRTDLIVRCPPAPTAEEC
nr:ribonuclease H-like domain-containing protein [Tanacetum cinerariifolium]